MSVTDASRSRRKGAVVTLAGFTLNAAMGVLFAWSVLGRAISAPVASGGFGRTLAEAALPYSLAIAMFALVMIPAGRLQDRFGPRAVALSGAALCGCGLLAAGRGGPDSFGPVILGFGLLSGTGIGFGYAAATPAAIKWFPPAKKGLVTGFVISGFGLAPVAIAPLAQKLVETRGVAGAFDFLGFLFLAVAGFSAAFITNPPGSGSRRIPSSAARNLKALIQNPGYRSLYVQMFCAAAAGLMIIGHIARIAEIQSKGAVESGFVLVSVLAVFNATGRVAAGGLSDRLGRGRVMIAVFLVQAVLMSVFDLFQTEAGLLFAAAAAGLNYGSCLSLFPAAVADRWGTDDLGVNYGLLFTAWGAGGVLGPIFAGRIADAAGSFVAAYRTSAGFLVLAAVLAVRSARRATAVRRL